MPLVRPILVTGTPRSGKSLVSSMLAASPEFYRFDEPLMLWDVGMGGRDNDVRSAADATPDITNEILQRCASALDATGKSRYLDHLSYHAMRIPFINAMLPDVTIIHTIRRPEEAIPEMLYGWTFRDSVTSAIGRRAKTVRLSSLPRMGLRFARNYIKSRLSGSRESWGPRPEGLKAFVASNPPALVAAFQWCEMVQRAMDDGTSLAASGRYIEVRYDDVLAKPTDTFTHLASAVRVQDPARVISSAETTIDPDYVFPKKVYPNEHEWELIREMTEPLRSRLGYQTWEPQLAGTPDSKSGASL